MEKISKNCSYEEATRSNTAKRLGISNDPNPEQLACMKNLATRIFEPIREHFGVPIYISSFFRSDVLNKAVKGASNSQHVKGEAMDIDAHIFGSITNKQIFEYIKDNLEYDQLIWEFGNEDEPDWVHVSYTSDKPNRKQIIKL